MGSGAIASDVEHFLLVAIDTVPHLEALLLIFQTPAAPWTVRALAARIYVDETQAAAILDDLTRRSLITSTQETPPAYQFVPRSPEQVHLLERVAEAYRTQLVQVSKLIHSKPSASVRDFARAFRLKDRH